MLYTLHEIFQTDSCFQILQILDSLSRNQEKVEMVCCVCFLEFPGIFIPSKISNPMTHQGESYLWGPHTQSKFVKSGDSRLGFLIVNDNIIIIIYY